MAVTTAAAAVAGVIAAGVGAAEAKSGAIRGRRRQQVAQEEAKAQAISQARKADEANAQANRKTADVNSLLTAEQQKALTGAGSTLLTGPSGVDAANLKLGRKTLLGG